MQEVKRDPVALLLPLRNHAGEGTTAEGYRKGKALTTAHVVVDHFEHEAAGPHSGEFGLEGIEAGVDEGGTAGFVGQELCGEGGLALPRWGQRV